MQIVSACLWFDDQAEAAANFYVSIFNNSRITQISRYFSHNYRQNLRISALIASTAGCSCLVSIYSSG
ncbi:MAG: hypothetical protein JWM78_2500 [Verrucomicrobiaceae bacterium]|nr:hypothetical protein [Verrucomicrobiaceae bacterium]